MNSLKDKIVLITGGASGMGAATAKCFHEEGATVIVTGSSKTSVGAAHYAADGSRFTTGTELRVDGGISAV